ncbi:MAG: cupin domain-containing protein [Cyanobium sp. D14.bin.5]|nr:cupin domain-containing protein [Cyanobium sp. D14.bin.5]
MLNEDKPGFHVWHAWCDHQGVSHQKKEWLDDFKLITFIQGIASVWQSGPRDDTTGVVFLSLVPGQEYEWHENPVLQWIVPIVGRWFVTTMDGVRVEMGPGEISFGADQNCRLVEGRRGHLSGAVGSESAVIMLIQVASNPFGVV